MYTYCDLTKFNILANSNVVTLRIYAYIINKCQATGRNRVKVSYRELQDILHIGHTSVARGLKTLKEIELIKKVADSNGSPEYEIPRGAAGVVNFNFEF